MNNIFNINRFIKLIKFKYTMHSKALFLQVGGIAALFVIISGFVIYGHTDAANPNSLTAYFVGMWIAILFGGGFYLTSKVYSTLQDTTQGFLFMQLPVSLFEKLLFPLISTGVVFVFLHTVIFGILVKLQMSMWGWFFDLPELNLMGLGIEYYYIILAYLVFQPVFLLGALIFKRFNFVLTNISLFVVGFVGAWLQVLIFYLAFGTMEPQYNPEMNDGEIPDYWPVLVHLAGLVIFSVFVTASYYKLKEKEV